jgi:hypothetical protein
LVVRRACGSDNGEELAGGESSAMLAELERRIGG